MDILLHTLSGEGSARDGGGTNKRKLIDLPDTGAPEPEDRVHGSEILDHLFKNVETEAPRVATGKLGDGDPAAEALPAVFTAAHESQILRGPFDLVLRNGVVVKAGSQGGIRACMLGARCVGHSPKIKNFHMLQNSTGEGGIALMQAMTPLELQHARNIGKVPKDSRMCVLCCKRHFIETSDAWHHSMRCASAVNWFVNPTVPATQGECAFRRDLCYPPEQGMDQYRAFVGVVANVIYNRLAWEWCGTQRCWRLSQGGLLETACSPAPVPAASDLPDFH